MSAEQIIISQDDPIDSWLESLESTASGISSETGVSLNHSVRKFLESSQRARRAQTDVTVADESAPVIAFALFHHLRTDGFQPELLVCTGFTGALKGCAPVIEEAVREFGARVLAPNMIHFVVRAGNIVLDLGYLRLGTEYMNSNNTMMSMFKKYWKKIEDVPGAERMRNEDFLRFARSQLAKSSLKKIFASVKDQDDTVGLEFAMAATAASVVNAFSSAKRNRRVRMVTAATASTPAKIIVS